LGIRSYFAKRGIKKDVEKVQARREVGITEDKLELAIDTLEKEHALEGRRLSGLRSDARHIEARLNALVASGKLSKRDVASMEKYMADMLYDVAEGSANRYKEVVKGLYHLRIVALGAITLSFGAFMGVSNTPTGFAVLNNNLSYSVPFYGGLVLIFIAFLSLMADLVKVTGK